MMASDQDPIDWLCEQAGPDLDDSHVLLFYGFDLTAAGILQYDIAPCLLCTPEQASSDDGAAGLTDEELGWGRHIIFVACGNCGTRGPWGSTESGALNAWNSAWHRQHPNHVATT